MAPGYWSFHRHQSHYAPNRKNRSPKTHAQINAVPAWSKIILKTGRQPHFKAKTFAYPRRHESEVRNSLLHDVHFSLPFPITNVRPNE
jgi:hypothetical protein